MFCPSSSGTRFFSGAMAWNSEPELYSNTSLMSPVESRVLTRLSPSVPAGRVSTLIWMFGFLAVKSLASWLPILTVSAPLSTRKERLTLPPPLESSLEPRLPALHAVSAIDPAASRAIVMCRFLMSISSGGIKGAHPIGARDESVRGRGIDDGRRRCVEETMEPVGEHGPVGRDAGFHGG